MERETSIERYIVQGLMKQEPGTPLDPKMSLLDEGILDSLGILELISFIEKEFGVTIEDSEVSPENFETLEAMNALLERKLNEKDT